MPYTTKQRQAILRCLEARAGETLTPAELAEELRRGGSSVGLATVYRQLEHLESAGHIHRIQTVSPTRWKGNFQNIDYHMQHQ